ncbi:MAG: hypothetical protein IT458_08440 [Planctomycetes bacterium]|nr:hypothetical protein [Planctomycetota bacterium]
MRISDLRPCDACGGAVGISFLRVKVEHLLVEVGKVQQYAAMGMFFGGAMGLAKVFADDECTKVTGTADAVLCWDCFAIKCSPLAAVFERDKCKAALPEGANACGRPQ